MVSFYKPKAKEFKIKSEVVKCESLDIQGRGVARTSQGMAFIQGLLPDESAKIEILGVSGQSVKTRLLRIEEFSPARLKPLCADSLKCGGCPLMHVPSDMELSAKIEGIKRLFLKNSRITLGEPARVETGANLGYRRICRLAIRNDRGHISMGFREGGSHSLLDISECAILTARINNLLEPLKKVFAELDSKDRLTQAEILDSDCKVGLQLRFTRKVTAHDEEILNECARNLDLVVYLSEPCRIKKDLVSKPEDSVAERLLCGRREDLYITSQGSRMYCRPSSFVQVNREINEKIVSFVIEAIAPTQDDKILDLFSGLGNFAFPLARAGAVVNAVDIVREMIDEANLNAKEQGLSNLKFHRVNLEEDFSRQSWAREQSVKAVVDPGRQGAKNVAAYFDKTSVKKIAYVSCNPLAASRDIASLIKSGYKIDSWGVFDMFPNTSHVETVILLSR